MKIKARRNRDLLMGIPWTNPSSNL